MQYVSIHNWLSWVQQASEIDKQSSFTLSRSARVITYTIKQPANRLQKSQMVNKNTST